MKRTLLGALVGLGLAVVWLAAVYALALLLDRVFGR